MLHELVLVQELQIAVRRDSQPPKGLLRAMCARRGLGLGWQQNQRLETPSSLSLVMTAESWAQLAWRFERLTVRLLA